MGTDHPIRRLIGKLRQIPAYGKSVMSMIAILLMSGLVTVIAVIGLADAFTHLLCWSARSFRGPRAMRTTRSSAEAVRPERFVA